MDIMELGVQFAWIFALCWSIFMGIKIMPIYVDKKVGKKGGTVDKVITAAEDRIVAKVIKKIPPYPPMPKFPKDIPSMKTIQQMSDNISKNFQALQDNMPVYIHNYLVSDDFATVFKGFEGRAYRMKGIELGKLKTISEDHQQGIEAAEKVYLEKIQNDDPNDRTELKLLLKDVLQVAGDLDFIDPDNVEQNMGVVDGVLRIIDRVQNRNKGGKQQGGSPLYSPPTSSLQSGGSELDSYYR